MKCMTLTLLLCVSIFVLAEVLTEDVQNDDFEDDGFLVDDDDDDDDDANKTSLESSVGRHLHQIKLFPKIGKQLKHAFIVPYQPPTVVQRVEVRQIIAENICPQDMDLIGDQCIKTEITTPCFVCPPSTFMSNGECLSVCRPKVSCPSSFDLKGGQCVSYDIVPAQFTCRNPHETLQGLGCVATIVQPPICPPGFSMLEHGTCLQSVPSKLICSRPDYILSAAAHQCVNTITTPASIVCPDGASFDSETQKCVVIKQAPPRCPPHFIFDAMSQTCLKSVPEIPAECPQGFMPISGICEKVDRYPAELFCSPEFILVDGVCIKEVPVPPACPPGFQHSSTQLDLCERIVKEVALCPNETTMIGSGSSLQCQSTNDHETIQCCPPGFTLEAARCRRLEYLVPSLSCGNECYAVRYSKASYLCPDGADFIDHSDSPSCIVRSPQCGAHRCSSKNEGGELHSTLRDDVGCAPIPLSCPEKEEMIAQPYCPDGGEYENGQCVLREPIIPQKICKIGKLDDASGQCVRETVVPVKLDCPGGTLRQGLRCISFTRQEPQWNCPEGSEPGLNGCCVVHAQPELLPPQILRTSPGVRCLLGRESPSGDCADVTHVPQELVCPEGSSDLGAKLVNKKGHAMSRCALTADLVIPPSIEKFVRPSYVCPDGAQIHGRVCYLVDIRVPESLCPNDTINEAGVCVRRAEALVPPPRIVTSTAIPICPQGAIPKGTTCVVTNRISSEVTCPDEFEFDGAMCLRSSPAQPVCPVGLVLTPDGCMRQIIRPPLVNIVQGCSFNVVPSCTGCPRDITSSCHA